MSPVCKMADNGRLTVDQKVEVVLFYAETNSVVATQRRFRAHFGTRWAPCKQTIYRLSLGTFFQPIRINSVRDVKCFYKNKNVFCVQSMVWHFVLHPVEGPNIKLYENASSGRRPDTCWQTDRQTDGHDEAKWRLSRLCEAPEQFLISVALKCLITNVCVCVSTTFRLNWTWYVRQENL